MSSLLSPVTFFLFFLLYAGTFNFSKESYKTTLLMSQTTCWPDAASKSTLGSQSWSTAVLPSWLSRLPSSSGRSISWTKKDIITKIPRQYSHVNGLQSVKIHEKHRKLFSLSIAPQRLCSYRLFLRLENCLWLQKDTDGFPCTLQHLIFAFGVTSSSFASLPKQTQVHQYLNLTHPKPFKQPVKSLPL